MKESQHAQGIIDLGKLILTFAKVNRVTMHEDGIRYESDTDHTVMLSICACSLASAMYPDKLDVGLVAQFAVVHDLVEVYAEDTNSINLDDEGKEEKSKREAKSLDRITAHFGELYPWLTETIIRYEQKDTREALFVKTLDKVMTRITNIHNKGAALRTLSVSRNEIEKHFDEQYQYYEKLCGKEFPELFALTREINKRMLEAIEV